MKRSHTAAPSEKTRQCALQSDRGRNVQKHWENSFCSNTCIYIIPTWAMTTTTIWQQWKDTEQHSWIILSRSFPSRPFPSSSLFLLLLGVVAVVVVVDRPTQGSANKSTWCVWSKSFSRCSRPHRSRHNFFWGGGDDDDDLWMAWRNVWVGAQQGLNDHINLPLRNVSLWYLFKWAWTLSVDDLFGTNWESGSAKQKVDGIEGVAN